METVVEENLLHRNLVPQVVVEVVHNLVLLMLDVLYDILLVGTEMDDYIVQNTLHQFDDDQVKILHTEHPIQFEPDIVRMHQDDVGEVLHTLVIIEW